MGRIIILNEQFALKLCNSSDYVYNTCIFHMVTHKQGKTVLTHYIFETDESRGQEMEMTLL